MDCLQNLVSSVTLLTSNVWSSGLVQSKSLCILSLHDPLCVQQITLNFMREIVISLIPCPVISLTRCF